MKNKLMLFVMYNLKPGVNPSDYEKWSKETDKPAVNSMSSVVLFEVFKTQSLFGPGRAIPYQYIEIAEIKNLEDFKNEGQTETMKKVMAQFFEMADNPVLVLCEQL